MINPRLRQAAFNAASRGEWEAFAGHRLKISSLLGAGSSRQKMGRLCVLGAGNCNDLDLAALLQSYREVHLVDLDADALHEGVSRQGVADDPALLRFGGIDVTGMLDRLSNWSPETSIRPRDIEGFAEGPVSRVSPALAIPFDFVASTCLLSPLIGNAFHTVSEQHPRFLALVQGIRTGHLRLLTHLAGHGGRVVLVTDVASTDTCPELATAADPALADLFPRLAAERRFFHGVNPEVIRSDFESDPVLRSRVADVELLPPWKWTLHQRRYLVWALKFRVV